MLSDWIPVPQDDTTCNYKPGDVVTTSSGRRVRVLGCSTTHLRVRSLQWWEKAMTWVWDLILPKGKS